MKKIWILILILAMPLVLVGCGEGDVASPQKDTLNEPQASLDQTKYSSDLEGLQKYLQDMDLISGQSVSMLSDLINAKSGVKYAFKYNNSNITAELYEFEKANDDVASQIESKGSLSILEKEVPATISNNKKFLLIYSDKSSNSQNIDRFNKIKEAVKNFKNDDV